MMNSHLKDEDDCSSTDVNSDYDIDLPDIVPEKDGCSSTDVNSDSEIELIDTKLNFDFKSVKKKCEKEVINRKMSECGIDHVDLTLIADDVDEEPFEIMNKSCPSCKGDGESLPSLSDVKDHSNKIHNISDDSEDEMPSLSERLAGYKAAKKFKHISAAYSPSKRARSCKSDQSNKDTGKVSVKDHIDLTEDEDENDGLSGIGVSEEEEEKGRTKSYLSPLRKRSYKVHDLSDSSDGEGLDVPSLPERLTVQKEPSTDERREVPNSEFDPQHQLSTVKTRADALGSVDSPTEGDEDFSSGVNDGIPTSIFPHGTYSDTSSVGKEDTVVTKKKKRTPEEIAESKRKAQMLKAEREKAREEAKAKKEQEKRTKAQLREAERERKKQFGSYKDSLQYIKLILDTHVVNDLGLGATIFKLCDTLGCKCATEDLAISFSIIWRREVTDLQVTDSGVTTNKTEKMEDEAIVMVPVTDFVQMVDDFKQQQRNGSCDGETLTQFVQRIQCDLTGISVSLVVMGMEKYFRDLKTAKQRQHREAVMSASNKEPTGKKKKPKISLKVSRVDIEEALTETQLLTDTMVYMIEMPEEMGDFLRSYTKAVADKPAKSGRLDSAAFSFQEEKVSGIRVDKSGHGLLKVWKQLIMQFKNVSPDVAEAIVSVYPSPRLLMKAYNECTTQKEAEKLLENIVVRRGAGVLETTRRVGKELSRRFYMFMTSTDPNLVIK